MFCSVQSMGLSGIESYPVTVEVDCRRGLPRFDIVGLPDTAVKESRERVHSAIGNLGYTFPAGVLVVNLAPADTKKSGPLYDLPDRKSTRLNSSHTDSSRMPSSA